MHGYPAQMEHHVKDFRLGSFEERDAHGERRRDVKGARQAASGEIGEDPYINCRVEASREYENMLAASE